mmetsp:Transcript_2471/g.7121  ORF Transcript_2471/g.7121 Transcript_2471/m.7121 type:complete len:230 (+) Transcript_2471:1562-2251(+)
MKSLPSPPSCFGPICWRTHSQKSSLSLTADSATAVETCSRRTSCSSERMSAMKGCRSVSSEKPRLVSRHTERESPCGGSSRPKCGTRSGGGYAAVPSTTRRTDSAAPSALRCAPITGASARWCTLSKSARVTVKEGAPPGSGAEGCERHVLTSPPSTAQSEDDTSKLSRCTRKPIPSSAAANPGGSEALPVRWWAECTSCTLRPDTIRPSIRRESTVDGSSAGEMRRPM